MKKELLPKFKIADNFLDLKNTDTSILIEHIEQQIELREMPIEEHAKQLLLKLKR